jgi:hypothetical protein
MRYATISTGFWTEDTSDWSASAKLLYLWTWTNDHAHGVSGVYACGDVIIAAETGLRAKQIEAARAEIGPKVRWYPGGWIWVVARAGRTCSGSLPAHVTALLDHLKTVPAMIMSDFWMEYKKQELGGRLTISRIHNELVDPHDTHGIPSARESESESESESDKHPCPPKGADAPPFSEIEEVWNSLPLPFKKIKSWGKERKRDVAARWGDSFWRENWRPAILKLPQCPFLRGEGPRGWVAGMEFVLRPKSILRIIEGEFDDNGHTRQGVGRGFESAAGDRDKFRNVGIRLSNEKGLDSRAIPPGKP